MRIWKILASIATLAIGLALWQYGPGRARSAVAGMARFKAL